MSGSARSRLLAIAKGVVGFGLLGILVSRADVGASLDRIRGAGPGWLLLVLLLPHVAIWISAVKWRALCRVLDVSTTRLEAFRLYLVGTFVNNFLPTIAGGDVVRTLHLGRAEGSKGAVAAATLMERLVGLGAVFAYLPLSLFEPRVVEAVPYLGLLVAGLTAAYAFGAWFLLSGRLGRVANPLMFERLRRAWTKGEVHLTRLVSDRRAMGVAFLNSLAFYAVSILTVFVGTRAVHSPAGLFELAAVVPLVMLIGQIPISLAGLGIKEAGYVVFLGFVGVPAPAGLALAVLLRLRGWLTAAIGGLLFIGLRNRETADRPDR